jgi:predicted enzyme related to lactoylglutathione lyase
MNDHHGIVHFEIPANDPEKLSKFYTDLFGWKITHYPMGDFNYWSVASGPTDQQGMPQEPGFINGGIAQRMSPDQRPVNYTNVESVDDYVKKATGLGAKLIVGKMPVPGMGWFAQLTDPEGNVFGVWQTDASAA